jgi:hypothetical protein
MGLKLASGRYMMLLNPDTIVGEEALECLVQFLETEPSAGIVGPRLLTSDGKTEKSCLRTPTLRSMVVGRLAGGMYLPREMSKATEVSGVTGAALMIRREVVERVGLLDERFFMYGEDTDWCYRTRRMGWKVFYVPESEIVHLRGRSAQHVPVETYVRRRIYRLMLIKKHGTLLEFQLGKLLVGANLIRRYVTATGPRRRYYRAVSRLYKKELTVLESVRFVRRS